STEAACSCLDPEALPTDRVGDLAYDLSHVVPGLSVGAAYFRRFHRAIVNGHMQCLERLMQMDHSNNGRAFYVYTEVDGHPVRRRRGYGWATAVPVITVLEGRLDCLMYLYTHGHPWDSKTCTAAAYRGHLNCLRYAHQSGCPWKADTCEYAAEKGHLDCLTYAHKHGCPWDEWTCRVAAEQGHLDCLKYAHGNG